MQRQFQRRSIRLTPKIEKLRQMSLCYPTELAFYCVCALLLLSLLSCHYFYHFFSISIFYLSSLYLVFLILFLCLIVLFDWFSLFSLYCILIFLLSLHPCSNNTELLIRYFLFWLSKSHISCHIIVVLHSILLHITPTFHPILSLYLII